MSETDTGTLSASSGLPAEAAKKPEAARRHAGVRYRLEGWRKGRRPRARAARAIQPLDRRLVRLAKQIALTAEWKAFVQGVLAHQRHLADQPTSLILHVGRKIGLIVAELGFTYGALYLAGIQNPNLRLILALALGGLLVLSGQTIARTTKKAHLAKQYKEERHAE